MKMYLIRHGETTGDIEDRFGGDYDDHLTENGLAQSQGLAHQLLDKGIEKIFVSPKFRARETVVEVEKFLQVPVEIVDDLRERNNYGVLTGLTKSEAKEKYPVDFDKISKDKTYHNVAGSESYDEITARVKHVFEGLWKKDHEVFAVVSHGGVISTYVREFLTEGKNTKLGDCAILEVIKNGDSFSLTCLSKAELHS